ncbi:MAG TPA: DUF4112 domain-containing protein [Pyrinomonadaceae bacterium]|nr:DUF4112 domain-containing protein [Pyrinomonadaceae bacterium]
MQAYKRDDDAILRPSGSELRTSAVRFQRVINAQPGAVEESLERLSWLMDDLFRVPVLGWRIGLDAILGLIPGFGDTATSLVSFYILTSAVRYRVPKITLLRMGLNIGIDYVLGSFPVVGDVFDAWWKSNHMNVDLLRRRARVTASEAKHGRLSDWLFVGVIILLLVGLAVGAAAVSLYLIVLVLRVLSGQG